MKKYPLSRKANVVVQELDGEVLIYDLNDNKAYCLNETSALVWQLCDGNKSITEISQSLSEKLKSPANEDLVWLALDQLKKEKLIENDITESSPFEGMNRREVIKKVGLGTMIALPVISSIIAPTSISAASGLLGRGAPCQTSSQCNPNNTVITLDRPTHTTTVQEITGACCRSGSSGNYGASGTCVPGTNGFSVLAAWDPYTSTNVGPGTLSCS